MIPDCDGRSDGQTVGRTVRQNLSWLIQRSAYQAMLTRCKNEVENDSNSSNNNNNNDNKLLVSYELPQKVQLE